MKRHLLAMGMAIALILGFGHAQEVSAASEGENLIAAAKNHMGTPYVFGGASPNGFDCSGFTQYMFKKMDIDIPRTTGSQANVGEKVSKSNLKVGDLIFFKNTYKQGISHVGIYVGNNKFISATSSEGVDVVSLDNPYWGPKYATARRVADFDKNELFPDLSEDNKAFEAVKTLTASKIINGYRDGTFKPDVSISRGQAAALINNALKVDTNSSVSFPDVAENHTFAEDIAAMKKTGIIKGFPDGNFKPDETIARWQMAIMMNRAFDLEEKLADKVQTTNGDDNHAIELLSASDESGYFKADSFKSSAATTRAAFSVALYQAMNQ
ncbi:hypothetical protein GLW08_03275 [Pontibacillus yanchengensis]|uniref:Uncharacterized protein n=2 Tax=Pontibacillus yanchengensis TaxID=462910 RepID=A0ACC7VCG9_9BACI|nr:C40 family peptidase [Pontibacillus yanchengensis]MYL35326.1 hypothetical protein [Pontibacillus yanchengensis]MYL52355.1 hypothetical protein [Pontibacillus yanchengensis]